MSSIRTLEATIAALTQGNSGILAADESHSTLQKRFTNLNIEYTYKTRNDYRALLLTTPKLEKYINGVILFEETLKSNDQNNIAFSQLLKEKGIVPGIKVDQGLVNLSFNNQEKITQGLNGLSERLKAYYQLGARFAKWRAIFTIQGSLLPSREAIQTNAEALACYASCCQKNNIVPMIEPEVLLEGSHSLEKCQMVTEKVLHEVFQALDKHHVVLEYIILKPNMVTMGSQYTDEVSGAHKIAQATFQTLHRTVPSIVPSINFLSGGHCPEVATAYLKAINRLPDSKPWRLNFSYSRALQMPALQSWKGCSENIEAAQKALYECARRNVEAIEIHTF